MSHSDPNIRKSLREAVDHEPLHIESDLVSVMRRASGSTRTRRRMRTAVAITAALALSVPVLIAGIMLRGQESEKPPLAGPSGSSGPPEVVIPANWGGTLLWSQDFGTATINSGAIAQTLPFEVRNAVLSPKGPEGGVLAFLGDPPRDDYAVIWYPDGRMVELPYLKPFQVFGPPAWSPDGARVALELCRSGDDNEAACSLVLVSVADGASSELAASSGGGVSWSPDGSAIVFAAPGDGPGLTVVDVNSGVQRQLSLLAEFEDAFRPAWSPSGQFIAAVASKEGGITVPIVLTSDGTLAGSGETTLGGSPPEVEWRAGIDTLVYTKTTESQTGISTAVWIMESPGWLSKQVAEVATHYQPRLLSSPDGRAVLIQTSAVSAESVKWSVIDFETGQEQYWVFDWEAEVFDWR